MTNVSNSDPVSRRDFLNAAAGVAVAAAVANQTLAQSSPAPTPAPSAGRDRVVAIQIGAISFVDEGVDKVLDILQERGAVNTLFVTTFTFDPGTGGRQLKERPLPDHGVQDYGDFHGGNFTTPHPQFYADTVLKDTKAPDHGNLDILELVLPKARARGMKVFSWNNNYFRRDTPNIEQLQEEDMDGKKLASCCAYNPNFRNFMSGLTRDLCSSYGIDGIMWCSEFQGPFNNALVTRQGGNPRTGCFCEFHRKAARERGIDVQRALEGYHKLDQFAANARAGTRPGDGYFVEFWRIMTDYPEILAWEKLWNDGHRGMYADIYSAAKGVRKDLQVGIHVWHENSFSPFHRAENGFDRFPEYADFVKPVVYNNAAGPRYAAYINAVHSTLFGDMPGEEVLQVHSQWLNYQEKSLAEIPHTGLSPDYVFRETKRAVDEIGQRCKIYPGIDVDIPTALDQKQTNPVDVEAATTAALNAGAHGVIFARKYSEMRLANLSGGGKAVREFGQATTRPA